MDGAVHEAAVVHDTPSLGQPTAVSLAVGPGEHVQGLRETLQNEWLRFRQQLDAAASQQFNRQEELFARCLERINSCGASDSKSSPPSDSASTWAPATSSCLAPKEREAKPKCNGTTWDSPLPCANGKDQDVFSNVVPIKVSSRRGESLDVGLNEEEDRPELPCIGLRGSISARKVPNIKRHARLCDISEPDDATGTGTGCAAEVGAVVEAALLPLGAAVQRIEAAVVTPRADTFGAQVTRSWTSQLANLGIQPTQLASPLPQEREPSPEGAARGGGGLEPESEPGRNPRENDRSSFQHMLEHKKEWHKERSLWKSTASKRCSHLLDWWTRLEEPQRRGRLAHIVNGRQFETLCAVVIIINALFTWYTTNEEMVTLEAEPTTLVATMERLFLTFYTIELMLKLWVHRCYFFCNEECTWNLFDMLLVTFSMFEQVMDAVVDTTSGTDLTFMRTLRILKMAKVLRGLRVLKFVSELRLILNSLAGSISSLFWSIVMLMLIFYIFGLVFVQGVSSYLIEEGLDPLHRDEWAIEYKDMDENFGSVQQAVLALYRASTGGDDWYLLYRYLQPTGALNCFIFIFFIAFSQIALLNILTAIFVQNAMKLAQPDHETQALEQRSKELAEFEELRRLMHDIDENKSGTLSLNEFSKQIKWGKLGAQLSVLGLNVKDSALFFGLISNCGNEVHIDDFIEACMSMRGHASCIDVHHVAFQVRSIQKTQEEFQRQATAMLHSLGHGLERMQRPLASPQAGVRDFDLLSPTSPAHDRDDTPFSLKL